MEEMVEDRVVCWREEGGFRSGSCGLGMGAVAYKDVVGELLWFISFCPKLPKV